MDIHSVLCQLLFVNVLAALYMVFCLGCPMELQYTNEVMIHHVTYAIEGTAGGGGHGVHRG